MAPFAVGSVATLSEMMSIYGIGGGGGDKDKVSESGRFAGHPAPGLNLPQQSREEEKIARGTTDPGY